MKNKDVINSTSASEKVKMRTAKSRWHKAMSAIACVVVFCTVYSLILPAITLEASAENPYEGYTLYCTQTEHTHTEECEEKTLICELTENPGHTHGEDCYSRQLICDKLLQEAHTHSEECYKTVNELSCQQHEYDAHWHSDDCYKTESSLTCQFQEGEGHSHAEDCFTTESQLTCETAESRGHTHGDNCKQITNRLTCTKEVTDPDHVHTEGVDGCYQMMGTENIICTTEGCTHMYDECYERVRWYHNCELHVHSREDGCYTETETVICGQKENNGHTHSVENGCYTDVQTAVCGSEEYDAHTHSGENGCYTETQLTICEKEETEGHKHSAENGCLIQVEKLDCTLTETDIDHPQHEATCYDYTQQVLSCDKEECEPSEHTHTDECYDIILLCQETEHVHDGNCYINIDSDDWVWLTGEKYREVLLSKTNMYVDMLPTAEEFEKRLATYESHDDWDGYEAYYKEVFDKVFTAYTFYAEHTKDEYEKIVNLQRLNDLSHMVLSQTYAVSDRYTVNMFNTGYANSTHNYSVIVVGGKKGSTIGEAIGSFGYQWWSCVVVNGNGVVTQVIGMGDNYDKTDIAIPYDGYALLRHGYSMDAAVGDRVVLTGALAGYDLSAATVRNHSSSGYGTIAFDDNVTPADAVKKIYDIPTLDAVDMKDKIRVNLFDYSDLINSQWYSQTAYYPGFQNPGGTKGSTANIALDDVNDFSYGDIITSDFGATGVAGNSATGKINKLNSSANRALNGDTYRVMAPTLINDKPALIDGSTYDLGYLFTDNPSKGVTQLNDKNITGLFRIDTDPTSSTYGNYYFDSRQNFAEFDAGTDTFTLYDAFFTPNYLMYPFGNFMPLNKIETTTTKVAEIDAQRFTEIAGYAAKRSEETSGTLSGNYAALASNLNAINNLLIADNPDWAGLDAADYYFAKISESARPDYYGDEAKKAVLENKLYNLDYDEESNFFFGMTIDFNFIQPKDGMYKSEHTIGTNLDAMKFNFAGDDDVWVYIDGVLMLDISGIHRHVGGTIDFQTGTVTYYPFENWDGEVSSTAYLTETFARILTRAGYTTAQLDEILAKDSSGNYTTFKDYTNHTFRMYYMERGSGSSVCSINFNMPVIKDNTIGVLKQVQTTDGDTSYLGNPWYEFQIFKADDNENKTNELMVPEGTEFEVFDLYGTFLRKDTVGANGVFCIKADEIAEFPVAENAGKYFVRELIPEDISDQIKFVRVDGMEQTTDNTSGFPVLSGFEGFDSNVKDISDGTTIFTYLNTYDVDRLGGLAITKTVDGATDNFSETFTFNVSLDGEKLPADTIYNIYDKNDNEIGTGTVGADSTVTIGHNQTAVIIDIAAGSRFKVQEIGATEYSVTYSGENIIVVGDYATGMILPAPVGQTNVATVQLNVTNYVSDEEITIPVYKVLNNFDGTERTFKFRLEQVDSNGDSLADTANIFYSSDDPAADLARYVEITPIAEDAATTANGSGQFTIPITFANLAEKGYSLPTTLYFKVSEVDEAADLVEYDNRDYIVAVPLSIVAGELTAGNMVITGGDSIVFTNTLLDSLKVSKTVIDGSENDEFTFTLKVNNGEFIDVLVYTKGETKGSLYADDTTGLYTFALKNGEEITIGNLPVGGEYQVTETEYNGFYPSYKINSADSYTSGAQASGTLTWIVDNAQVTDHVKFENRAGSELPHTGGAGTTLYTSGGVLLLGASLILGCGIKKRSPH